MSGTLVCFTAFNVESLQLRDMSIQYLAYSLETCPSTDRLHLQGFAYGAKMRRPAWQKALAKCGTEPTVHIEFCKGNIHDNAAYCQKAGDLIEQGIPPNRIGEKKVMQAIKADLDRGERPNKLMRVDEYFSSFAQCHRFFREYSNVVAMEKMTSEGFKPKEVYILTGPPGSGKSKYIYEHHPASDIYVMPESDGRFFGTYSGQPVVVFNDVDHSSIMPVAKWLNICDGYPIEVAIKGGYTPWSPDTIYFTSNTQWESWWNITLEKREAVRRRITAEIDINADA